MISSVARIGFVDPIEIHRIDTNGIYTFNRIVDEGNVNDVLRNDGPYVIWPSGIESYSYLNKSRYLKMSIQISAEGDVFAGKEWTS